MRPEATEATRPNLGRRPHPPTAQGTLKSDADLLTDAPDVSLSQKVNKPEPAQIQIAKTPNPLPAAAEVNNRFPTRSTRNRNPKYVDGIYV